jgi:hypothetical protein
MGMLRNICPNGSHLPEGWMNTPHNVSDTCEKMVDTKHLWYNERTVEKIVTYLQHLKFLQWSEDSAF